MAMQVSTTANWMRQFLPPRTEEQWAERNAFHAQRGDVVCSIPSCSRWCRPQFIREVQVGDHTVRLALCPDKAGRHAGIGPTTYQAVLAAYNQAADKALFAPDVATTQSRVRKVIRDGDPLVLVADFLAQRPARNGIGTTQGDQT